MAEARRVKVAFQMQWVEGSDCAGNSELMQAAEAMQWLGAAAAALASAPGGQRSKEYAAPTVSGWDDGLRAPAAALAAATL
jgi:hypothetical protein